ncbi:hypothetical protein D9M71_586420 [compost metagenome]
MRHHQEADGIQAHLAGHADVLLGDVGLGAVGRHANGGYAAAVGHLQVLDRADAGQQQRRYLGLLELRNHRLKIFAVAVRREAIVDGRAAQAVAMGDFDQRHAGGVEAGGHRNHLLQADLVALGMHAVAQAHIVQSDFLALQVHGILLSEPAVAGRPYGLLPRTSRRCADRRRS